MAIMMSMWRMLVGVACLTHGAQSFQGNYTWELVNLSTVYGADYEDPNVKLAGTVTTVAECQSMCDGNVTCQSFDIAVADHTGDKCAYLWQCYLRADLIWVPKTSNKCAKQSGRKVFGPPPAPPSPAPKNAMNVLFVIFDDLRIIHKPWGFNQSSTPNTDALAAKSLIFDNAYCQQAVCGPSRASLLSGRRPDTTQMWNFISGFRQTPGAAKWNTWPEWFLKNGYYTAGAGKLFHPGDPVSFDPQSWSGNKFGGYFGQDHCPKEATPASHGCPVDPKEFPEHKFPDVETLAVAKTQLANAAADRSRPFWIGTGFVKPHMPHVFPAQYLDVVPATKDIILATNPYNPAGTSSIEWGDGAEGPATWGTPADNATSQDWRRNYYAAAAFSDAILGELLGELDRLEFANNTIIIMTADHGWGLGEHNHWIKYTNYETDARIPLMVHHPLRSNTWGKHTKSLVEHVDLYPTIAALAGVAVNTHTHTETIEGYSYAALFDESGDPSSTVWTNPYNATFTQYPRCCRRNCSDFVADIRCATVPKQQFEYMGYRIRTSDWAYVEWAKWNGTTLKPIWAAAVPNELTELYSHVGNDGMRNSFDDFENENVANGNAAIVQSLSRRLRAFFNKPPGTHAVTSASVSPL